jgi:hypothetical protein
MKTRETYNIRHIHDQFHSSSSDTRPAIQISSASGVSTFPFAAIIRPPC